MAERKETFEKDIRTAVAEFEKLVREQVARNDRMIAKREAGKAVPVSEKDKIVIGACAGDGIGTVITEATERVLEKLLADDISSGRIEIREIEGLTIERRLECGQAVPDDVLAEMEKCDVLLKGPTLTPDAGMSGKNLQSANVFIRKYFDLFANVRPISIPEQGIDWMFFRENTEGEYALGSNGVSIGGELDFDFKVTTKEGTRRIAEAAFKYAKENGKKNVAVITKANILKKTDGAFLNECMEVAKDYPDINVESYFIDIMSAHLVNEKRRSSFNVFVMPNLYGDILTDEAAQINGGVGTAGSANIGADFAMFEAIHGSAPRMLETGRGHLANPSSLMNAAVMMMDHIGRHDEARRLAAAIEKADREVGGRMTGRPGGASCDEYTDIVLKNI